MRSFGKSKGVLDGVWIDCCNRFPSDEVCCPLNKKRKGSIGILYELSVVPVVLFLMNGILLRHYAVIIALLLYIACHAMVVQENQG